MDEELTLTHLMEPVDEHDKFLLDNIQSLVQNTNILPVVSFWGHSKLNQEKTDEQFLLKISLAVNSLLKANANRRTYLIIKDRLIEEIKNDPDIQNTNIDILFNKIDAFVIIEGFLTQIKTSLDLLAQSLKPIYGLTFHTYARRKDEISGKELSGLKISNSLENLSADLKSHAQPLIDLIKNEALEISKIVAHRDSFVHYGQNKRIQGFRFSVSRNDVFSPIIAHSNNEAEYVHEYMDNVLQYMSAFTQEFVVTILSNLMTDMIVAKRQDGTWGFSTRG